MTSDQIRGFLWKILRSGIEDLHRLINTIIAAIIVMFLTSFLVQKITVPAIRLNNFGCMLVGIVAGGFLQQSKKAQELAKDNISTLCFMGLLMATASIASGKTNFAPVPATWPMWAILSCYTTTVYLMICVVLSSLGIIHKR